MALYSRDITLKITWQFLSVSPNTKTVKFTFWIELYSGTSSVHKHKSKLLDRLPILPRETSLRGWGRGSSSHFDITERLLKCVDSSLTSNHQSCLIESQQQPQCVWLFPESVKVIERFLLHAVAVAMRLLPRMPPNWVISNAAKTHAKQTEHDKGKHLSFFWGAQIDPSMGRSFFNTEIGSNLTPNLSVFAVCCDFHLPNKY